mgnify:FL=1
MECDKYTGWEKRNGAKRSLAEPLDISSIRDENEKNMRSNTDVPALVIRAELMGIIDKNLPVSLRADFKKMMEDVSVGKQKRDKVINAIREILEEDNGKAR